MTHRYFSRLDKLLIQIERGLTTVCADRASHRPYPAEGLQEDDLTPQERRISAGMMRVNHAGEVCAQALYEGQMVMAASPLVLETLKAAAAEETDHLAWTQQRLTELHSHTSFLNPFWYAQAYCIGLLAGLAGDRWSLGFIEETEHQVTEHLERHLGALPAADLKSHKILEQMRHDEQRHGHNAASAGAYTLPSPVKILMTLQAKVLTTLARWI